MSSTSLVAAYFMKGFRREKILRDCFKDANYNSQTEVSVK